MNQGRWTTEKANAWYGEQPWLVGYNFIPSTAINQLEMWQADTFDADTIKREQVGCYNWGPVSGKTQTIYPWGSKKGSPEPEVWFHDIFRKDGAPYSVEEVELIKNLA